MNGDLPLSFVMALSQNEPALKRFEGMNEAQKKAVINKTRKINSKHEMRSFVDYLSEGNLSF